MARILVATTPSDGHVNPVLPIVGELSRRGHEIRWYTGAHFRRKVEGAGAEYLPMREAYDFGGKNRHQAFPHLDGLRGVTMFREVIDAVFVQTAPAQHRDLVRILADFPADVLMADEMCFGAGLTHEITGCRHAMVATSIYMFGSRDTAPVGLGLRPSASPAGRLRNRLLAFGVEHFVLRGLWRRVDGMRAGLGLRPRVPHAPGNVAAQPDVYLLGTVPSFEYPRSDLFRATHFVGPLAPARTSDFTPPPWWDELRTDRPVVHVTQGTVSNDEPSLLEPTVRGLADEDVLVVATTGETELASPPANVRQAAFVPHAELLPHVDVMITNGGYGGVQAALAHGIPLVVGGETEEKPEVAAHVAWSGAGIDLRTATPSPARLRAAVREVLRDPSYRTHARRIQAECAEAGGPRRAAELVEEVAQGNPR
ncbi:glycosyltransferase [Actinocrispum wychmicini]|uniref:MGT family glycosyltransferase n=1 Tax=Actinocrispum wychmicini TaxID=1213861 RepID=A0A4R2JTK2_9PSEU|nr:nucleotide disphospho-sugar-binding domain-containing protein [Actinocrispum wychmicini]TCO60596.1 MGT family glycosyltransferase [Actinocrispum wychmicini]